jgi:hypothetical protein
MAGRRRKRDERRGERWASAWHHAVLVHAIGQSSPLASADEAENEIKKQMVVLLLRQVAGSRISSVVHGSVRGCFFLACGVSTPYLSYKLGSGKKGRVRIEQSRNRAASSKIRPGNAKPPETRVG